MRNSTPKWLRIGQLHINFTRCVQQDNDRKLLILPVFMLAINNENIFIGFRLFKQTPWFMLKCILLCNGQKHQIRKQQFSAKRPQLKIVYCRGLQRLFNTVNRSEHNKFLIGSWEGLIMDLLQHFYTCCKNKFNS